MALRINPIPPNSPTIKIPGTLVSKHSSMVGTSTLFVGVPNTNSIAPTGQFDAHNLNQ
jgi:hypothetical protein